MNNENDDLRRLDAFIQRMQPMIDEFHAIVDRAFVDDPAMRGWRARDIAYDLKIGSIRPGLTGVPEGRGVHPKHQSYWMPDRHLTVELAARTIEHRSRRFTGRRVLPVNEDWKDQLRDSHAGMFECEFSVDAGWADLIAAYVEMRLEAGDRWEFIQIKEKFGSLRLYDVGDDSPLESIADHLSMCICETCGAPGRERDGGWIRTLCDDHAEDQS
ncbi:hypothetical protein [Devosia nitrariae]|uniref:Uncharacterized protein n=1 Tax=Devosia nitrariae TaxID=2071872 RepID=A0ABQ5W1H5_9HYPH|nr:hypothetical protein [Devosia nitrariae]GLQ53573.1 hypothetical protein GCM10010862_08320 [Devosia nitrariae]